MKKKVKNIVTVIVLVGYNYYIVQARQIGEGAKAPTVTVYNHTDYVPAGGPPVGSGEGIVFITPGVRIPYGGSVAIHPGIHEVSYLANSVDSGKYTPQRYWSTFAKFNFRDGQTYEVVGHPLGNTYPANKGTLAIRYTSHETECTQCLTACKNSNPTRSNEECTWACHNSINCSIDSDNRVN